MRKNSTIRKNEDAKRYEKRELDNRQFVFTKEEKEQIEKEADQEYFDWSEDTRNLYINYKALEKRLEENPNRWFVFINKDGERKTIDLSAVNVKGLVLNRKGKIEDANDAEEIRSQIFSPLIAKLRVARKAFESAVTLEKSSTYEPEVKRRLMRLFGEMNSIDMIIKIMKEEEGYSFSQNELLRFYAKNKSEIDAKRTAFLASSKEYKIASEAGRLQILNNILTDLNLKYSRYMTLGKEDKALTFSREIRNILEQARKEIKGNDLKLTVDGKIDVVATMHGHDNQGHNLRRLSVNSIVIGIVAAKAGLNPTVIIHQLATSYYKDFNGFNKNILGTQDIMLPGDIIRGADWNELRKKNEQFLNEMQPYHIEEATYQEVTTKENVKSKLEKLKLLK